MNQQLFLMFNKLAGLTSWSDWLVLFVAEYLGWILVGMLIIHYADHKRSKRAWRELGVVLGSAVLAWLVVMLIKISYVSDRPFAALTDVTRLVFTTTTNAFPSGHTAFFTALGTSLVYYHRGLGLGYFIAALLIGLARVIAAVHWPADILAGAVLGTLIGILTVRLVERRRLA